MNRVGTDDLTKTPLAPVRTVTVIGGGTGSFNILSGLRRVPFLRLSSVVTMTDSGGDSGRLRHEFNLLPPGDLRRCLIALSEESPLLRELFNFRFEDDPLRGRQLGNLMVLALTKILGNEQHAIDALHRLLRIQGRVLPVSWDNVQLCAELCDGTIIHEEANIDVPKHDVSIPIKRVFLKPEAQPNPEALAAIAASDFVILAPGDLYTSTIPNLLVKEVPETLQACGGKIVYVLNLMTKRGETDGYSAARHVEQIATYAGRLPDVILANTQSVPLEMAERYLAEDASPVALDELALRALGVSRVHVASIMSSTSKARHDSERTAAALLDIFAELARPAPADSDEAARQVQANKGDKRRVALAAR